MADFKSLLIGMMEEQAALLLKHIAIFKAGNSTNIAPKDIADTRKIIKKVKKEPVDPNKPKKSPSAYLLYMGENQAPFKLANPKLSQIEVMTSLGNSWTALPSEAKERFVKQANTHKELYEMKMAAYISGSSSSNAQSSTTSSAGKLVSIVPKSATVAAQVPHVVVTASVTTESEKELKKKRKRAQKEAEAGVLVLASNEAVSAPESEKKKVLDLKFYLLRAVHSRKFFLLLLIISQQKKHKKSKDNSVTD